MSVFVWVVFLGGVLKSSRGFQVVQPQTRTVNSDDVVSLSCEHSAEVESVHDVRLNRISPTGTSSLLCPGAPDCIKLIQDGRKYVFVLKVAGPEALASSYQCEVTVKQGGDIPLFHNKRGTPTQLERGAQRATLPPPPPPPPSGLPHHLMWTLVGLLVVMSLYSCLITLLFIRAKLQRAGPHADSATYVEMRRAARPPDAS